MNTFEPLVLDPEYNENLSWLENSDKSIFITGKAGTGKSTFLQLFRQTSKKNIAVLAPTGIAALNVQGQTIHSFFGFPGRLITPAEIRKSNRSALFKKLDTLIIDEISMVRADMLDGIDKSLRIHRGNDLAFGGVQVLFFGDLFQLPPVVATEEERWYFKNHYPSPFFFDSNVMKYHPGFEYKELTKVYRQEERNFISILDNIRTNSYDWDDLEQLNERVKMPEDKSQIIVLAGRNQAVEKINNIEMERLVGEERSYTGTISGNFDEKRLPTDFQLKLKIGAKVMFVKNDPNKFYVNGTLGIITALNKDNIKVKILDNQSNEAEVEVTPITWEMYKYKINTDDSNKVGHEITGSFTQYPLRLAWALTIHKSQGKTFDMVGIDNRQNMFEHGQLYVALSRCRTLGGIYLKAPIQPRDIIVNPSVIEFHNTHF